MNDDVSMNMRNASIALTAAADALMEMSIEIQQMQTRIGYLESCICKEENFKRKLSELLHDEGY